MTKHSIEWLNRPGYKGETWNPIIGCSKASAGCQNCYAERMAKRQACLRPGCEYEDVIQFHTHKSGLIYTGDKNAGWNGKTAFVESAITKPMHWKKPRQIFVCSMGDLFHESVPFEWIDKVFAVMALCPQHTFQVLTKRPEIMAEYLAALGDEARYRRAKILLAAEAICLDTSTIERNFWFLDHIHLGTSAENQEQYDLRTAALAHAHGFGIRFVSIEPMLGPIDLHYDWDHCDLCCGTGILARWPKGKCHICNGNGRVLITGKPRRDRYWRIDWVICGGESGPGARPMNPDWVRSLLDQCASAAVPFFFKQWGEWAPNCCCGRSKPCRTIPRPAPGLPGVMFRCGKHAAGRMLDGHEYLQYPEVTI